MPPDNNLSRQVSPPGNLVCADRQDTSPSGTPRQEPLGTQLAPAAAGSSSRPATSSTRPPPNRPHSPDPTMAPGQPGPMTTYIDTFRTMTLRRLTRELQGTYAKPRGARLRCLLVLGFLALEVGLASITLQEGIALRLDFSATTLLANLLGLLLLSVLLYCAVSAVSVIRWCLFWIAAGSIALLIIAPSCTPTPQPTPTNETACALDILGLSDFTVGGASTIVASVTLGICLLNILLWLCYNRIYPHAIRQGWPCVSNLNWFFSIRPHPRKPGYYTYRIPLPFPFWLPCCGKDRTFGYKGEVDQEGRPHGLGTWTDDAKHGECLQGVWQHGKPIGPFRASEYNSDYRFQNVRMAFAHNRMESHYAVRDFFL